MKFLYFLFSFFQISVSNDLDCSINEYFCLSVNGCINSDIDCINRCELCMKRQKSGENIACINDCSHDVNHLTNNCLDTKCEDSLTCPSGFIIEKNHCQCNCVINHRCNNDYVCPKITQISIDNDNINGFTVYELSLILTENAYNIYAIYGDQVDNMIIPPAYQVHQHIGSNIGGINPVIINYIHESLFDSWFTIEVTDGDDMGYINSIGINWMDWTQDNGLTISDGAIFLNDPVLKLSDTNEYIISHLTVDDRSSHLLRINVNGRIFSPGMDARDLNSYRSKNIEFIIPQKSDIGS